MAGNEKQGTLPPTPSIKSIVEGFLFAERANMELTEEKLKSLVKEINEMKENVDDLLGVGEDSQAELRTILTRLDNMLGELTKPARRRE